MSCATCGRTNPHDSLCCDGCAMALMAAACYGAVARLLGLLVATLDRWETAARQCEDALRMHAQFYARAIDFLHQALDTARELGMQPLQECAESLLAIRRISAGDTPQDAAAVAADGVLDAVLSVVPQSGSPSRFTVTSADSPADVNTFRRQGDYWTITYDGTVVRLKDAKGLHYIACLLRDPGRTFHVLDLIVAVDKLPADSPLAPPVKALVGRNGSISRRDGTQRVLDRQALTVCKRRLADLREALAEAQHHRDQGRIASTRQEIDFITRELMAAYGREGCSGAQSDAAERARKAVTNRIRASLGKLHQEHPALWRHLSNALKTGTVCVYTPETPVVWAL